MQSSGSNGVVERAAQGVEGQIRVVLIALEDRVGRQLDPQEAVVTFIPEYAAYVLNRLEVGKDGQTAYEMARGKKATVVGIEFGGESFVEKKEEGQDGQAQEQEGIWDIPGSEEEKWRALGGQYSKINYEGQSCEEDTCGRQVGRRFGGVGEVYSVESIQG